MSTSAREPGIDSGVTTDPVVELTVAATTARNPASLWQAAAHILSRFGGGAHVKIDFTDDAVAGSVEAGQPTSVTPDAIPFLKDRATICVTLAGWSDPQTRGRITSFIETAHVLTQLVNRRVRLEHERRVGSFIVELSRWMTTTASDPGTLLRYALESTMQLAEGHGAFAIMTAPNSPEQYQILGAAGTVQAMGDALVPLVREAVDQVTATGTALLNTPLNDSFLEQGSGGTAMFVPLRANERVLGALGVIRGPREVDGVVPFSLEDVSYTEAVASHIAGGLELAQAIARAQRAAQRAGAMVDRTPIPLALLDENGKVIQVNDAFARLVGLPGKAAAPGRWIRELPLAVNGGSWDDALQSSRSRVPWRARVEAGRHGEVRYCEGFVTPLAEEDEGDLLLALHDRTDELRAQRELVSREKLAAVGEIASGVAHEVNNPLATIRFEAEMLGETAHDPETSTAVQTILKEVDRAAHIAKGLLRLSRQSTHGAESVDLRSMLRDIIDIRSRVLGSRGTELTSQFAPDTPSVPGIASDLQQVFVNLITNAEHAVQQAARRIIVVTTERAGKFVRVGVHDTGAGVPNELRAKIFDAFFTTKGPDVGTGLGLAISARIVHEAGGELWVEDSDLGGAVFYVELPTA